jgi:Inner membrane protein YgaP-like, transmembrane domain
MTENVGLIDRSLRAIIGLLLIAFAVGWIFPGAAWNWIGWIGIVPLLTAVFGYCPAYSVLHISSCSRHAH